MGSAVRIRIGIGGHAAMYGTRLSRPATAVMALWLLRAAFAAEGAYDPLAVSRERRPAPLDLAVDDKARSREIPVRVHLPAQKGPAPVVLFSHGLGGSRRGCGYLGTHWAARGYAAVFLQHPGSDSGVWEHVPPARRMDAMRNAAGR